MTATDELRRMLDERGVEWWQSANALSCIFMRWHSPMFGDEVVAMENGEEGLVLFDRFMTPEQAIDATLGRGTCHLEINTSMTAVVCDRCNYPMPRGTVLAEVHYCPSCGAEVVE